MWVQTGSSGNCRTIYSFPSHPQQNPAEASSTQCWSQPAPCPQLWGVGDHQSIQAPIQHHPAQLSSAQFSSQPQLSSSVLVSGSNLAPPAVVPCAARDHLPPAPTQSHNALGCLSKHCQWQPITTDHSRGSGIPQGASNFHPSGAGSSKDRAKLSLPHPSALGAQPQDGRHTDPLCSALRFHRLLCSSTTCCTDTRSMSPSSPLPTILPPFCCYWIPPAATSAAWTLPHCSV